MRSTSLLAITAMTLNLPFTAQTAIAAEIHCPSSIKETPSVSKKDEQWVVVASSGERLLERVGIYLGTPSEHGAQVPDSENATKKTESVTWRLRRAASDAFWVGCSYVGTTAMLFKKVDTNVTTCVASYDLLPSGRRQRLSTMDCR
jgi:hypothetical protein